MNILPKKRWHVRTKDNIARVRKDEAEAAEKQRKIQNQINKAEQEARINYLRSTCDIKGGGTSGTQNITNLDILNIADSSTYSNKEYEKEKKLEKEKYEKQIGYLTYVGQHRNQPNLKRWYELTPQRYKDNKLPSEESDVNKKYNNELKNIKNNILELGKEKSEKKMQKELFRSKCKSHNIDKTSLMDLRKKRLIREAQERKREKTILKKS